MPITPFEAIALDHLSSVQGGCKKKCPPPQPPPQAAPAPSGTEITTNVQMTGFGATQ